MRQLGIAMFKSMKQNSLLVQNAGWGVACARHNWIACAPQDPPEKVQSRETILRCTSDSEVVLGRDVAAPCGFA